MNLFVMVKTGHSHLLIHSEIFIVFKIHKILLSYYQLNKWLIVFQILLKTIVIHFHLIRLWLTKLTSKKKNKIILNKKKKN
jgi:hypothetical protein